MSLEVKWEEAKWFLPKATDFATHYPKTEVGDPVRQAVEGIGEETVVAAFGYGSSFQGDADPKSLLDMLLIAGNIDEFHRLNTCLRPKDYGTIASPAFHSALSRGGVNFYRTTLDVDGQKRQAKYGVVGLRELELQARGTRPNVMVDGDGMGFLYLAGRLQKARLVPIIKPESTDVAERIDQSINQARIDGLWLTLGLLPERFGTGLLTERYVGLSYKADLRVEKAQKVHQIVAGGWADYVKMLEPMLDQFCRHGVLERESDAHFKKLLGPSEGSVKDWLRMAALASARNNYLKNPLTFGIGKGIVYSCSKIKRSLPSF